MNNVVFQSKADHLRMCASSYEPATFCSCDLDLDPMTLIYELDLNTLKMYLHTKDEVFGSRLYINRTETHSSDRTHCQSHSRVLKIQRHSRCTDCIMIFISHSNDQTEFKYVEQHNHQFGYLTAR